jgi:hypothetical protein
MSQVYAVMGLTLLYTVVVDKSNMFTCLTDLARPLNLLGGKHSDYLRRYRKSMNQKQNKVVMPNRFGATAELVRRHLVLWSIYTVKSLRCIV